MRKAKKKTGGILGESAPKPKPAAAAQRSPPPQPADLTLVGTDDMLWMVGPADDDNRIPAPPLSQDDFGPHATGACVVTLSQASRWLHEYRKQPKFEQPLAVICKKGAYAQLMAKENRYLIENFHHEFITLYFEGRRGVPIEIKCLMFQFGQQHVVYDNLVATAEAISPQVIVNHIVLRPDC